MFQNKYHVIFFHIFLLWFVNMKENHFMSGNLNLKEMRNQDIFAFEKENVSIES